MFSVWFIHQILIISCIMVPSVVVFSIIATCLRCRLNKRPGRRYHDMADGSTDPFAQVACIDSRRLDSELNMIPNPHYMPRNEKRSGTGKKNWLQQCRSPAIFRQNFDTKKKWWQETVGFIYDYDNKNTKYFGGVCNWFHFFMGQSSRSLLLISTDIYHGDYDTICHDILN